MFTRGVHARTVTSWETLLGAIEVVRWLLGHELQHVLEVAQSPEVRTEDAFREFYERIGFFSWRNTYDTNAALEVGARDLLCHRESPPG